MHRRRTPAIAAVLISFCGASAANADPATPEGARAIERAYAAYFSNAIVEKGVLTVAPQGDDYVVTLDFQKAIAAVGGPPDVVAIAPFAYRLTPSIDGGWLAKASSFPTLTLEPTGKDKREGGTIAFDGFLLDSLYDPAAPDFWRGKLGLGALAVDLKAHASGALQHMKIAETNLVSELRVRSGEDVNSIDLNLTQTVENSTQQSAEVEDGETAHEGALSETRQGPAVGEGHIASFRGAAFGDFWRFVIAHADETAPSPDVLKPKLEALLPLWRRLEGKVSVDNVAIALPGAGVTIKSAAQEIKLSGLAAEASAEFGLALKNLGVEFEAAPDWTKAAWPASLQLHVAAGVDGLDRAAHLALDDPEFIKSGKLADETREAIVNLLQEGHPHLTISDTRLSSPLIDATVEGGAELVGDGAEAHATVTADTLDKVLQLVANIGEDTPDSKQMLFVVTFIKGLAKQQDGRLVWDIKFTSPNALIVNGQKLGSD